MPPEKDENLCEKLFKIFTDAGIAIPDFAIDRAHRIGKQYVKNGVSTQAVIVWFTRFYHRTLVYCAHKSLHDIQMSLDLMKSRLAVLKEARKFMEDTENVPDRCFVYADINCFLRIFLNSEHVIFLSVEELQEMLFNEVV